MSRIKEQPTTPPTEETRPYALARPGTLEFKYPAGFCIEALDDGKVFFTIHLCRAHYIEARAIYEAMKVNIQSHSLHAARACEVCVKNHLIDGKGEEER